MLSATVERFTAIINFTLPLQMTEDADLRYQTETWQTRQGKKIKERVTRVLGSSSLKAPETSGCPGFSCKSPNDNVNASSYRACSEGFSVRYHHNKNQIGTQFN